MNPLCKKKDRKQKPLRSSKTEWLLFTAKIKPSTICHAWEHVCGNTPLACTRFPGGDLAEQPARLHHSGGTAWESHPTSPKPKTSSSAELDYTTKRFKLHIIITMRSGDTLLFCSNFRFFAADKHPRVPRKILNDTHIRKS